jgi:GntR family negative regulator for fad regulon and positive regulator of fabA
MNHPAPDNSHNSPTWSPPQRPNAYAEEMLITAILEGHYPAGSTLPGERELAGQLGVTRPTLREALRRLERDGWLTIQQGKATRVNDYWREGGPNILTAVVRYGRQLPAGFIRHLLEVRQALAPAYTGGAVAHAPAQVSALLAGYPGLPDTPDAFAAFDWRLHQTLTLASGNPVYTLILNGFAGFYEAMARLYFTPAGARHASRQFYADLLAAAGRADATAAQAICQAAMDESLRLWVAAEPED